MEIDEFLYRTVFESRSTLSEESPRGDFSVYYYQNYLDPIDLNRLKRLALYYDTILIPNPLNEVQPFITAYYKKHLDRIFYKMLMEFGKTQEFIENGIVMPITIDDKYYPIIEKTIVEDFRTPLSKKIKNTKFYGLERHNTLLRSQWLSRFGIKREHAAMFFKLIQSFGYVDEALLISSLLNATPIMENFERDILEFKIRRAVITDINEKIPPVLDAVLNVALPYANKLSMNEIVTLRKKSKGPFRSFRRRMNELAFSIKSSPWDKQFREELEIKIESEILPELRDLRIELKSMQPDLKSTILKALVSKIPYIDLIVDAYEIQNTFKQKKALEKNGLYFLARL
jgi:hypothetical protein